MYNFFVNNNMKHLYSLIIPLFLLSGCSFNSSSNTTPAVPDKTTLLIQVHSYNDDIGSLITEAQPLVNNIIKEELGLDQGFDFDFFLPKDKQRITLYYVSDLIQNQQDTLLSSLEKLNIITSLSTDSVFVTAHTECFGNQHDEVVIMVDDEARELANLNEKIKESLHRLNNQYQKNNDHVLYDISKSERLSFVPHMGLGRIRIQSIKNHIKDELQHEATLERIRQRITKEISGLIESKLFKKSMQFVFDRLVIFDPKKQAYIKEWLV